MSAVTLAAAATHAIEVRHSRFVAHAMPADDADEALASISSAGDPAATHNCWAYRIGAQYRSSDDGEPSGTAGRPILAAIDGQGFDRIAVVVTRWYGGIKLGAGGLVRAYGGCAAECLRLAPSIPITRQVECRLAFAFADTGAVHAVLNAHAAVRIDEAFDEDGVSMRVRIPEAAVSSLRAQLRDATRDRARLDPA